MGKQKTKANDDTFLRRSLALALKARALVNIDQDFFLAHPAVSSQPYALGVRSDSHYPAILTAVGTFQPAVFHCQYLTIIFPRLQWGFRSFP